MPAYAARVIGDGEPFEGKTEDFTLDVTSDTQGQWFTGLETLNSSATSTTITTSYAQNAFTFPVVSIMLESFANVGSLGIINLDTFKYEKGAAQVLQAIGSAIFGYGAGNTIMGLEGIVDDTTNLSSIGGQSRSTYSVLNATRTAAASSKLTLAQMATLYDTISAAGLMGETPNVGLTTKTVWSLYEQLLTPNVRASYEEVGYDRVPMRAKYGQRNSVELRNSAGFDALSYRGFHIMKDDFATSGVLYFLNEDYINFYGRKEVPDEYKEVIEHVDFGSKLESYEGTGALALEVPSEYHGFYFQKPLTIPEQAGRISRFYVIGQFIARSFRRQGKLVSITGV
jgi:ribosomal protein L31